MTDMIDSYKKRRGSNGATDDAEPESGATKTKKGKKADGAQPPIVQIENYLRGENVAFRYNIVKNAIEVRRGEKGTWDELTELLAKQMEYELSCKGFRGVSTNLNILLLGTATPHDPMQKFLAGVDWDGDDHIGRLCEFVTVDEPRRGWFKDMLTKHLVRLVACATDRLPFNKQIFVLQGAQNDGKSSFIRFLIPPELSAYYTEFVDFSSKDGQIAMARNYVINLDELSSLSRHDVNQVKAFLSTQSVKARLPFDKRETVLRRRCTFFATTNADEFLTDTTGNVRWLVMPVKGFKHDNGGPEGYAAKVDIRQVYAQAASIVAGGDYGELDADEIAKSERYNSAHMKRSLEYELILQNFKPSTDPADFKTVSDIRNRLQMMHQHKIPSAEIIGKAMQALHRESGGGLEYKQLQKRVGLVPVRGYLLKEIESAKYTDEADAVTDEGQTLANDDTPF